MAKYYHIKKLNTDSYLYIILSKSYVSPIDEIEELERDLEKMSAKGKIIFDLLLSNGDSPDRYFEAEFDGKKIIRNTFKQINLISRTIEMASVNFYRESFHLLENSVLTRQKKFLLKKSLHAL